MFEAKRGRAGFPYNSCVIWFFHVFYDRLFDVHPEVKPLFQNDIIKQGHKLVEMISLCINLMDKSDNAVVVILTALVKRHHGLGVTAGQYNFVVETILYALETTLGDECMNQRARKSWLIILSRMLAVMIPAAVDQSMKDDEEEATLQLENLNKVTSTADGEPVDFQYQLSIASSNCGGAGGSLKSYSESGSSESGRAWSGAGESDVAESGKRSGHGSGPGLNAAFISNTPRRSPKKRLVGSSSCSSAYTADNDMATTARVAAQSVAAVAGAVGVSAGVVGIVRASSLQSSTQSSSCGLINMSGRDMDGKDGNDGEDG